MSSTRKAPLEPVAPPAPGYGSGCYRRAIRLSAVGPRRVEAVLEDDPHAFALHIEHDGERVTAVRARAERFPLTTCPGATQPIEALAGAPLSTASLELKRHADPRRNCTHLFDLAALAIAHAARGAQVERRYDIEIPDARDGRTVARLFRDGECVLQWTLEHGRITAPPLFAGQQVLGGFTRWASATLAGEELEHALMLARGFFVALARLYDMDAAGAGRAIDHAMPSSACHSYSPGVVEHAWRVVGSRRDFTTASAELLRWHDPSAPARVLIGDERELASFIAEFEACTLPRPRWTHHAHLVVAWWYLGQHGFDEALAIVRHRIRAYNEAVGTANTDTGGYHETLTRLFLRGVAEHRAAHPEGSIAERIAGLLASPMSRSEWPLGFYSRERLFSVEARRGWVEPDRSPG